MICPRCGYGKNGEWRPVLSSVCRTRGGCPVCAGRIVVKGVNDVATVHPEIAEQWHPTLNAIKPDQITSGSGLHILSARTAAMVKTVSGIRSWLSLAAAA